MIGSIIGGIFGGMGNLAGSKIQANAMNKATEYEKQMAEKNLAFQQEKYAYDKDIQQQIFGREDNSIQRRVADLKSAGLSPVLAAGQGAQAGSVVKTEAPQMQSNASEYIARSGEAYAKAFNSFSEAISVQERLNAIKQQQATISKTNAEKDYILLQGERSLAETDYTRSNLSLNQIKAQQMTEEIKQLQKKGVLTDAQADAIKQTMGIYDYNLGISKSRGVRTNDSPNMYSTALGLGGKAIEQLKGLLPYDKDYKTGSDFDMEDFSIGKTLRSKLGEIIRFLNRN